MHVSETSGVPRNEHTTAGYELLLDILTVLV
jgi:hypothetical protein